MLSVKDFTLLGNLLFRNIAVVPEPRLFPTIGKAREALGSIDPDDVVFLAAALALGAPIWTSDRHLSP